MTAAEYQRIVVKAKAAKRNKYNAVRTIVDGICFDSKDEAKRYGELKILERAGRIIDLLLQPRFILQQKFTDNKGTKHRAIWYYADFQYHERKSKVLIVEDVKGQWTPVFSLKMKMFLLQYPEVDFRIYKDKHHEY